MKTFFDKLGRKKESYSKNKEKEDERVNKTIGFEEYLKSIVKEGELIENFLSYHSSNTLQDLQDKGYAYIINGKIYPGENWTQ